MLEYEYLAILTSVTSALKLLLNTEESYDLNFMTPKINKEKLAFRQLTLRNSP
jgi:hypothetical protein